MTRLLGIPDLMERYGCCRQTASAIIHQMKHLEYPRLLAPEWAVEEWERAKVVPRPVPVAPVKGKRKPLR